MDYLRLMCIYTSGYQTELDEKTKAMLRIIEEDADSFAERAEMYYKKRPELINLVEDCYRAHRSLAERHDQVKSDAGFRLVTPLSSPLSSKYRHEKLTTTASHDKSYHGYSETDDPTEPSNETDVTDQEQEMEKEEEEEVSSKLMYDEVERLREEIGRLGEENKIQKEQLAEKDEEKRGVIRQLSLALDVLKDQNVMLRKFIAKRSPGNGNSGELVAQTEGDDVSRDAFQWISKITDKCYCALDLGN